MTLFHPGCLVIEYKPCKTGRKNGDFMAQNKKTNSPDTAEPARSRQKGQTQGRRASQKSRGAAQNAREEQAKSKKPAEKSAAPAALFCCAAPSQTSKCAAAGGEDRRKISKSFPKRWQNPAGYAIIKNKIGRRGVALSPEQEKRTMQDADQYL